MLLDSTSSCLKTTQQVSPYSSELEKNWTSSFLVHSDKLVIGPHLLLSPASTVVKPAEHEFAHHPNPIQGASQRSQHNRKSKLLDPRFLHDPWAHNL